MKRLTRRSLMLSGIVALALVASTAGAGPLYAVRGNYGIGRPADLIEVDPATGDLVQVIGYTGLDGVGGLAVHPTTGALYAAVSGGGSWSPHALYTLNPLTGAATPVGADVGLGVKDMIFNSAGTLYAVDSGNNLVTVNITTGVPTVIGLLATIGGGSGMGIAFDSADTLYVKDLDWDAQASYLYTVDPTTAAILTTTLLAVPDSAGYVLRNSLAFDENDVLYSIGWEFTAPGGSHLVTIDPATGVVTDLPGTIPRTDDGVFVSAIDFAGQTQQEAVPEPASLSLLALGGLGLLRRRRRK